MNRLRVAMMSLSPAYGRIDDNLAQIKEQADVLSDFGVELACFPEMYLTGYSHGQAIRSLAQSRTGPAVKDLLGIVGNTGVAIVAGMPEQEFGSQEIYVTQFLCTPEGECGCYRKIHLSRRNSLSLLRVMSWASSIWRTNTIGLQLCYDAHFPELSLAQALCGAEVLLLCFASPMGDEETLRERWQRFLPARAYDTGSFVLACNQAGASPEGVVYSRLSMAFSPEGRLIGETHQKNEPLIVDIDLSEARKARECRPFLQLRRPEDL